MIGPVLGALTSLAGAGLQWSAAHDANVINWMNLQFQKQSAKDQFDLATATRPDVYGNELSYDKYRDEWEYDITPEQQAILDAGEREQLLSLTEDAPRARELRRRQDRRSKEADEVYREELAPYRYQKPGSAGSFEDEGIADVIRAMQGRRASGTERVNRAAFRMGEGARLPQILKTAADTAGSSVGEDILRGKELGRQRRTAAVNEHQNRYLPSLERFAGLADKVNPAQARFSDLPQMGQRNLEGMLSSIMGAERAGAAGIGNAYSDLASSVGSSALDLSGVAKILAGMDFGGGSDPTFSASVVEPVGGSGGYTLGDRTGAGGSTYRGAPKSSTNVFTPNVQTGEDYWDNFLRDIL